MSKKKTIERIPVKYLVCGYEWEYSKGIPKYMVRCLRCGSVRNDLNRKTFGKMKLNQLNISTVYSKNNGKYSYVYYAHSISFYNTWIEKDDLEFLRSLKHTKIVNPNGLALGKDMFQYLFLVKQCDAVWYRGNTIGVVFEVLTALAMHKPVYSLETKGEIQEYDISYFVNIFRNNYYFNSDLLAFKVNFPKYYNRFIKLLQGDFQ